MEAAGPRLHHQQDDHRRTICSQCLRWLGDSGTGCARWSAEDQLSTNVRIDCAQCCSLCHRVVQWSAQAVWDHQPNIVDGVTVNMRRTCNMRWTCNMCGWYLIPKRDTDSWSGPWAAMQMVPSFDNFHPRAAPSTNKYIDEFDVAYVLRVNITFSKN